MDNNNKGQTIFLSVIGIATLLVAIIGATFAWFNVSVQGNANASSIYVTTAQLGTVVFTDGNEIVMDSIRPETSPNRTKTFYVINTDSTATESFAYSISLNVTTNTISPLADGAFVYSLSGAKNGAGTVATTVTEQIVPESTTVIGSGSLSGTETHTYTFTITLKETSSDQNSIQGKTFNGFLSVE